MNKQSLMEFHSEALEQREMLAGNVTVVVDGDDVLIRGDGSANSVQVSFSETGELVVEGGDGTVITGGDTGVQVSNLTIRLGGGDDTLTIDSDPLSGIRGNLTVIGNAGDDAITLRGAVEGTTEIRTGGGHDSVFAERFFPKDEVFIGTSCGDDSVNLLLVEATTTDVSVFMRGGQDSVDIESSNFRQLDVSTGGGDDDVTIAVNGVDIPQQVSMGLASTIHLGAGHDQLETRLSTLYSIGPSTPVDPDLILGRSSGLDTKVDPRIGTASYLIFTSEQASLQVAGGAGSDELFVNGEEIDGFIATDILNAVSFASFEIQN